MITYLPQNWTIYYWAYWMVWCVASPFFIGRISKGRSIRQVILGGYMFGAGSTMVSIIAAFPIGMVIILIVISFFKDVEKYKKDLDNSQKQTK